MKRWFRAPVSVEVTVSCWSDKPMTLEAVEGLERYLAVMKRAFTSAPSEPTEKEKD